jgi:hypothetical protein
MGDMKADVPSKPKQPNTKACNDEELAEEDVLLRKKDKHTARSARDALLQEVLGSWCLPPPGPHNITFDSSGKAWRATCSGVYIKMSNAVVGGMCFSSHAGAESVIPDACRFAFSLFLDVCYNAAGRRYRPTSWGSARASPIQHISDKDLQGHSWGATPPTHDAPGVPGVPGGPAQGGEWDSKPTLQANCYSLFYVRGALCVCVGKCDIDLAGLRGHVEIRNTPVVWEGRGGLLLDSWVKTCRLIGQFINLTRLLIYLG